jgi:polysaccharide export outer membrane protein
MKLRKDGWAGALAAAALAAFVVGSTILPAPTVQAQPDWEPAQAAPPDPPAPEAAPAPAAEVPAAEPESAPAEALEPGEPAATPAPAPSGGSVQLSGDAPDYVIGAADVVRVAVWKNPELSTEVPVRPDGRITVPLLGDVAAAGLTTSELRDAIAAGFAEYVTAPDVTVSVSQVNSKVVFLVGEVLRPSAIPLNRDMRVLDAIAVGGGFSPFADRNDVKILRPLPDGTVERHEFNYPRFVKGKDPEANLVLQPGDTIVVPD